MAKRRRKRARRITKATVVSNKAPIQARFRLAWRDFVLFLLLFIISYSIYKFSSDSLLVDLFGLLSIITGFLTLAFLVVWVILWIVKAGRN